MKIVGAYSFNGGKDEIETNYPDQLTDVYGVIRGINAEDHRNKISKEINSEGDVFYSPRELNKAIKASFKSKKWKDNFRVNCDYPTEFYTQGYSPSDEVGRNAYREMDFIKNKVGIEVQFGKYSFMVYNVAAKMTIFHNLGHIDVGIEIVPVKEMASQMSSGVSYFEQFLWDLQHRGVSNIDIPVLILGICPTRLTSKGNQDNKLAPRLF